MNKRENKHAALLITILLMLCLLAAGLLFVLPAVAGRLIEQTSPEEQINTEKEAENLRAWLGLDTVRAILAPEGSVHSAADKTKSTQADSTAADSAGKDASANPEEPGEAASSQKSEKAEKAESSPESEKAEKTEKSLLSEEAKMAESAEESEKTASPAKVSEKKEVDQTESKTTDDKKAEEEKTETKDKKVEEKKAEEKKEEDKTAEEKKADSKKTKDKTAEEKKGDSEKTEGGKTEAEKTADKKTEEKDADRIKEEENKKKDPQDSMTKLQKQYVQDWEEYHGRAFPLNAPLHNYNWKYLQYDEMGRLHYEGDKHYTVRHGIDVSEFQGRIDWEKVRKSGIDFVFVRAGHRMFESGELVRDSRAIKNLTRAKKAGLEVGVYVFSQAVTESEAREEAQLCLDVIKESGVEITLPIVFDPEIQIEYYARINFIDGEQFTDNTLAFCKAIKKAGYTPAVYANCSTETDILDMSRLDGHALLWYADYNTVPESPYQFTFWQYSNTGRVEGIPETETDLNVWFVEKQ